MSRWFRFYDAVLDDPKVQKLDPKLFKAWVNLLCLASRNDGRLPAEPDIAFAIRCTETEAARTIAALVGCGLIDAIDDGYEPHNWNERQFKSDGSAERVRRFRKRHGNVTGNGECNVTGTADGTGPDTEQNRADSEQKESPPSARPMDKEIEADFEQWYAAYPLRKSRQAAFTAYRRARKAGETREALLTGAERYRDDPRRNPDFTKHPATWLNQRCWLDEAAAVAPPAAKQKLTHEEREEARLAGYEVMIKRKQSPGQSFTAQDRFKLIQRGSVTMLDCEAAGCAA